MIAYILLAILCFHTGHIVLGILSIVGVVLEALSQILDD